MKACDHSETLKTNEHLMTANQEKLIPTRSDEKKRDTGHSSSAIARLVVDAALDKKADDIVVLRMAPVGGVADFFILCSGDTDLQIKAITDNISSSVKSELQETPWHKEGDDHYQWVVLDYVDVVVHVMSPERRGYYGIERLWGDAEREDVTEEMKGADVHILRSE